MAKSDHQHHYEKCLIKQNRIIGNKIVTIWITGEYCTLCGKTKPIEYIWFKSDEEILKENTLPIVEQTIGNYSYEYDYKTTRPTTEYFGPYQTGWVCPKCGSVMAPTTTVCPICGPKQTITVTC